MLLDSRDGANQPSLVPFEVHGTGESADLVLLPPMLWTRPKRSSATSNRGRGIIIATPIDQARLGFARRQRSRLRDVVDGSGCCLINRLRSGPG